VLKTRRSARKMLARFDSDRAQQLLMIFRVRIMGRAILQALKNPVYAGSTLGGEISVSLNPCIDFAVSLSDSMPRFRN
jgi:hypothetical protein